jgi:carbon-monoxide dehydrogenase large subunit
VVANAVVDALAGFGVTHIELPLTAEKVWRAMHDSSPQGRESAGAGARTRKDR